MLDISFKKNDNDLYELKVQFGSDVDPDALLTSIGGFIDMVKKAPALQPQVRARPEMPPKEKVVAPPIDSVDALIENMSDVNRVVLVCLHRYEQEHSKPAEQLWDITNDAKTFRTYAEFAKDKDRKQEVTALRYQLKLLREKGLVESPPTRALTPDGIEVVKRVEPQLKRIAAPSVVKRDERIGGESSTNAIGQEVDIESEPSPQPSS